MIIPRALCFPQCFTRLSLHGEYAIEGEPNSVTILAGTPLLIDSPTRQRELPSFVSIAIMIVLFIERPCIGFKEIQRLKGNPLGGSEKILCRSIVGYNSFDSERDANCMPPSGFCTSRRSEPRTSFDFIDLPRALQDAESPALVAVLVHLKVLISWGIARMNTANVTAIHCLTTLS